jgi:transcriptional regulator with XRE-family HTH domain
LLEQIKAARALLGWSQTELGRQAGLSLPTVKRFEGEGKVKASEDASAKIVQALRDAGIEFTNGDAPGVRDTSGGFEMTDKRKITAGDVLDLESELAQLAEVGLNAIVATEPSAFKVITALTMGLGHFLLVQSGNDADAERMADEAAEQLRAYVRNDQCRRAARRERERFEQETSEAMLEAARSVKH